MPQNVTPIHHMTKDEYEKQRQQIMVSGTPRRPSSRPWAPARQVIVALRNMRAKGTFNAYCARRKFGAHERAALLNHAGEPQRGIPARPVRDHGRV